MTTAEAELELASQKRPRDDDEADAAAAPVDAAPPAAKAARLEGDVGNKSRVPEATEKAQDTNDASICNADAAADATAADAATPAAADAKPAPPPPSTSAALLGLPQRWDANQLRTWLRDELQCDFTTCRKKRGGSLAFVTFPSVDARRAADAAARRIGKVRGGGRLVLRDERGGGGKGGGGKGQSSQGHQKGQHKRACDIDVRDIVTPLWRLPYAEQLAAKARRLRGVLARIEAGIGVGSGAKNPTGPIDFVGILRSPTTEGYRNKCEFTVGLGVPAKEGEEAAAGEGAGGTGGSKDGEAECGFCLGAYRDGIVEVGPASECRNASAVARACAAAFSRFMRERSGEQPSGLAPWDKRHNSGFWRLLIVREGRRETVLPRPPKRKEGEEEEGAASLSSSPPPPPPPPPPFASLDWRPWLVSSADLLAREEEAEGAAKAKATATATATEAGGEAVTAAAAPAAAAPSPAAASPSDPPRSSSFEAPPADEILLVVQVDPTAPGATGEGGALAVRRELVALGKALRAAVAGCRAGFDPPSGGGSPEWSPARLVLQHHSGLSNSAPDDAPLLPWPEEEDGDEKTTTEAESGFITDSLCGLRFRVSPSSFFQVNSGAAALLYRLALDWAGLEKREETKAKTNAEGAAARQGAEAEAGEQGAETGGAGGEPAAEKNGDEAGESGDGDSNPVFLDVCCGTGTIGICAAAAGATRVVGVDVVAAAIRDAEANARANGLSLTSPSSSSRAAPSCRFVAAKAEDVMASLLAEEEEAAAAAAAAAGEGAGGSGDTKGRRRSRRGFVAVVDPPRAGLHPKVRSALRGCPAVSRVVYVSCNPDTLASDCVHLCTRGGNGRAFRPVRAAAADLFPMTSHCEAVLLLER